MIRSLLCLLAAALCELAGCFTVWAWLRLHKTPLWLVPGAVSLGAFAWLLSRIETPFAGRAYAAYGGIYIAASLLWLRLVEHATPSRWDLLGSALSMLGSLLIIWKQT
ncbi:MAG: YnfA family protein [Candidatus Tectimicrobiota bacterium]